MGFLIATLMAQAVMAMMLISVYSSIETGVRNVSNSVFAGQATVIADAFTRYVKDHAAQLAQIASPATPATLTTDTLIQANYLPTGTGVGNAYQQQYVAMVLQPLPGSLRTMLFTVGGDAIPIDQIVPIAAQATDRETLGGFVPYPNQAGDSSLQPGVAVGVNGSFRQDLTVYGSPGAGHLAMMLAVADASATNGYLYRVDMKPLHPELNAMQTDLSMTDTAGAAHDIVGVNSVNLPSGAAFNSDQGGSLELGDVAGSSAAAAPYIDFHHGGTGPQDFNTRIVSSADQRLAVVSSNGQVTFDVHGGVKLAPLATPGASCPENGVMATNADGSGQVNVCQYEKWMPVGGPILRYGYFTVADSSFVPAPNCPSGAQQLLQLSLQGFTVNQTATVNGGPATWTGNGWIVHLQDGAGNSLPGTATVGTYCYYGT